MARCVWSECPEFLLSNESMIVRIKTPLLIAARRTQCPGFSGMGAGRIHWVVLITAGLVAGAGLPERYLLAQSKSGLLEREPFDRITLKDGTLVEVYPIDFPGRELPESPSGVLTVRNTTDDAEYEIEWKDVERDEEGVPRIELFEQMVLVEANQLVAAKDLDEAFFYFLYLRQRYPNTAGLQAATENYLRRCSGALFSANKLPEALSAIEELYALNPKATGVARGLNTIATDLVTGYRKKGDLSGTRNLLRRLLTTYGAEALPGLIALRDELDQQAAAKRDEARVLRDRGRFRDAFRVSKEMLELWPDVAGGKELAIDVATRYPLVLVGVHDTTSVYDAARIENWAARRMGRLTGRMLLEFDGAGPNGGHYISPYGAAQQGDDRQSVSIELRPGIELAAGRTLTAYDLAHWLGELADPTSPRYVPHWAGLARAASVQKIYRVRIDLRRPHVLPESMLQIPLARLAAPADAGAAAAADAPGMGPFLVGEVTPEFTRFVANPAYKLGVGKQPAEVQEHLFEDRERALVALEQGTIDVLDDVAPGDAEQLRENSEIEVKQYAHPTVHVLVPNYDKNPFMARRFFRQGLVHAIKRDAILQQLILNGKEVKGCQVVSGPFPVGTHDNDPLSYAYDHSLEPREYSPRQAMLLMFLAEHELKSIAEKRNQPPPLLSDVKLVLGHPADPLIQAVCQAIVDQLALVSIPVQLKQLPRGETTDSSGECDLVYTRVAIWEPINDARLLLRPDSGIISDSSQHLDQALRRLDASRTWQEVRRHLLGLHHLTYHEVTVLPLWQTVNFLAHRKSLSNINPAPGTAPITLYQNVENWQIVPTVE